MLNFFWAPAIGLIETLIHKKVCSLGLESREYEGPYGKIHYYYRQGEESLSPLILIHGITATAYQWLSTLFSLVKSKHTLIVPDLIGHGRSAEMNRTMNIFELRDCFNQFLSTQAPKKDLILIGNSLGGTLSLFFAAAFPERVKSLFLISPGIGFASEKRLQDFKSHLNIETPRDARLFFSKVFLKPLPMLPITSRICVKSFKRKSVSELIKNLTFADQEKLKVDVTFPDRFILLLWGRKDHFLPRDNIVEARALLPSTTVFEDPEGVGHCPQVDTPRWTAQKILSFIESSMQK